MNLHQKGLSFYLSIYLSLTLFLSFFLSLSLSLSLFLSIYLSLPLSLSFFLSVDPSFLTINFLLTLYMFVLLSWFYGDNYDLLSYELLKDRLFLNLFKAVGINSILGILVSLILYIYHSFPSLFIYLYVLLSFSLFLSIYLVLESLKLITTPQRTLAAIFNPISRVIQNSWSQGGLVRQGRGWGERASRRSTESIW